MPLPTFGAMTSFDKCVDAIKHAASQVVYINNRTGISNLTDLHDAKSENASWSNLVRSQWGNRNAIVSGSLTKKNMMDLYTDGMVGANGESRKIYDAILVSAGGQCPFCGGLGHARTLDHYLPKAIFPAYSVNPHNLVPCCRDCNSGKNASFATVIEMQTLHPYYDKAHFFDERWVTAEVFHQNPLLFRFACDPPANWSQVDRLRVQSHFEGYDLSVRFSVKAGAEISKVIYSRRKTLKILTENQFKSYLADCADSSEYILNGWYRTMYRALSQSDWFSGTDFDHQVWNLLTVTPLVRSP